MGAHVRGEIDPDYLRVEQVGLGRFLGSVQELCPVDDLHDAVHAGAVAEIDAVAFGPSGDGAVQVGRHWARRPGLLAG